MMAWGRSLVAAFENMFKAYEYETSLVKMFRIEYGREFEHMRKNGYTPNDASVRAYINDRKHYNL
jgi:hypothetical protein